MASTASTMVRRVESSEEGICVMSASQRSLLKAEDTAVGEREQMETIEHGDAKVVNCRGYRESSYRENNRSNLDGYKRIG